MAGDQVAVIVMEMHAASFAIAEHVAVCALSFPCPFPIAIFFEAVVPDINKAVFVDIFLMEVGTDARTAHVSWPGSSGYIIFFYGIDSFFGYDP